MLSSVSARHQLILSFILLLFAGQLVYGATTTADAADPTRYVTIQSVNEGQYISGEFVEFSSLSQAQQEHFTEARQGRVTVSEDTRMLPYDQIIRYQGDLYVVLTETEWENEQLLMVSRVFGFAGFAALVGAILIAADTAEAFR